MKLVEANVLLYLAALAVEHNGEIVSFDSDLGRFDGVIWERPGHG